MKIAHNARTRERGCLHEMRPQGSNGEAVPTSTTMCITAPIVASCQHLLQHKSYVEGVEVYSGRSNSIFLASPQGSCGAPHAPCVVPAHPTVHQTETPLSNDVRADRASLPGRSRRSVSWGTTRSLTSLGGHEGACKPRSPPSWSPARLGHKFGTKAAAARTMSTAACRSRLD